jgi:hypothetical protein
MTESDISVSINNIFVQSLIEEQIEEWYNLKSTIEEYKRDHNTRMEIIHQQSERIKSLRRTIQEKTQKLKSSNVTIK